VSSLFFDNASAQSGRREALRLMIAIAAALVIGFCITLMVSDEPVRAYLALLTGALPEFEWSQAHGWQVHRLVRFGSVIEDAITLSFLGLAILIPFRARQFSLGADGQMFLSALAAAAISLWIDGPWFIVLPAAALAALSIGFVWGLIPGLLKARFGANEIVTTLMLNLIAVQIYRLIITEVLRDPHAGMIATPVLPDAALMPILMDRTNVSVMLFAVPIAAFAAWLFLMRTTWGYEIRVVGQAPEFARQTGMPVTRAMILSMAMGGLFAALAGLHISNALLKRLPVDLTPGIGFDGLVVALLARNDPKNVPVTACLYAYLRVGAQAMERTADVSREIVLVIQAFIILFVVAEGMFSGRYPKLFADMWQRRRHRASSDVMEAKP
jgi:simple sugar transport system permease protein